MVAELLALVDVGDVNLDDGAAQRADAVVQRYAGVGVGTGVKHNAVVGEAHLLHLVDKLALYVALIVLDVHVRVFRLELWQILFEGRRAVDAGFAGAQQVQVWTVDNDYFHHAIIGE